MRTYDDHLIERAESSGCGAEPEECYDSGEPITREDREIDRADANEGKWRDREFDYV